MINRIEFNMPKQMESNPELELARDLVENTGVNVFVTGRAGTGKTTFLRDIVNTSSKRLIVTAPTGIAAINAGGVTLHSFFQLPFSPFSPSPDGESIVPVNKKFNKDRISIIRSLDLLIIDEISMVRADLLDAVDNVLRLYRDRTRPFGGVQLLMIGDPYQLPPVVVENEAGIIADNYKTPYFFDSYALQKSGFVSIELKKVYRQEEGKFLDILNAIRDNRLTDEQLDCLNARCCRSEDADGVIRLTTHNALARRINEERLAELPGEEFVFKADISGNFPETSYPADPVLRLKQGAQVMFVRNDSSGKREYFNGLIGIITDLSDSSMTVTTADGEVRVVREEWHNNKYVVDKETREIKEVTEGAFMQYPVRLAWGITIHKSQGLTFDRAVIDASRSFAHGQTYVALSRCRTLDGLILSAPLSKSVVICDPAVAAFANACRSGAIDDMLVESYKKQYCRSTVADFFDMGSLINSFDNYSRVVAESFSGIYPKLVEEYVGMGEELRKKVKDVAIRFISSTAAIWEKNDPLGDSVFTARISKGAQYFMDSLGDVVALLARTPLGVDNKAQEERLSLRRGEFEKELSLRVNLFKFFRERKFNVAEYKAVKGKIIADDRTPKKGGSAEKSKRDKHIVADEVVNPKLFSQLCEWRSQLANERKSPAFTILSTRCLKEISALMPKNGRELLKCAGIGKKKLEEFGDDILDIVANHEP